MIHTWKLIFKQFILPTANAKSIVSILKELPQDLMKTNKHWPQIMDEYQQGDMAVYQGSDQ